MFAPTIKISNPWDGYLILHHAIDAREWRELGTHADYFDAIAAAMQAHNDDIDGATAVLTYNDGQPYFCYLDTGKYVGVASVVRFWKPSFHAVGGPPAFPSKV